MTQAGPTRQCWRCKDREAVHTIRSDHICNDCFNRFVTTKTVKRLAVLNRETRSSHGGRPNGSGGNSIRTFYAGLSFGPSSAALVDICEQIILGQLDRGRNAAFTLHVVHVDTDLEQEGAPASPLSSSAEQRLDRWRTRHARFTFECVPLTDVLALDTIDWEALCPPSSDTIPEATDTPRPSTAAQLRALLAGLPSATSRRDVLDLLVRRLLIARAASPNAPRPQGDEAAAGCAGLLLGCSTTALAARTLAETAKGRGFSLPWQINDGPVDDGAGRRVPLYYPLRELFRNELVLYTTVTQPPLTEGDLLLPPASSSPSGQAAAVVSHKDLSIEEVMARYFAEVEANYPSIVANVVRTTAKLERHGHGHSDEDEDQHSASSCRVCGMPLDEAGNERWMGELGHIDGPEGGPRARVEQLCYGCERSIHG